MNSSTADYVAGHLWARRGTQRYLLRHIRRRMSFHETIEAIHEMDRWAEANVIGHRGHRILIERAANGDAIIDYLQRQEQLHGRIEPMNPDGGKKGRANAASAQVEGGHGLPPRRPQP